VLVKLLNRSPNTLYSTGVMAYREPAKIAPAIS